MSNSPRTQFSLLQAMTAMTVCGVVFGLTRLEGRFPYWTILPAILFTLALRHAQQENEPVLTWSRLASGWLVASYHLIFQTLDALDPGPTSGNNTSLRLSELLTGIAYTYGSNFTIPILLSVSTFCCFRKPLPKRRSIVATWIKICVVVILIDVHLLIAFVAIAYPAGRSPAFSIYFVK